MFKKSYEPYPNKSYPIKQIPSIEPNAYQQEQINRGFGMFLHFGINTFNNVEWSNGKLDINSYNPTSINAEQWIKTAYEAGMNYVILITKHHDGFCLWDTDTTKYSIKYSPCKIDVVKEVANACKKYDIKLGLYYSLWDRNNKNYKSKKKFNLYLDYMETQLKELLGGYYGEIIELWLDGSWDKSCRSWGLDRLYNYVKIMQPKCQIGVNLTIGKFTERACIPNSRYKPLNYRNYDPIRMFPSDFRLWDPLMCRKDDPKIYTFNGEKYYLPFEQTICSRKKQSWFYSDKYEYKDLINSENIISNYKILKESNNLLVINLPPNKNGELVQGDIDNLLKVADALNIRRKLSS